MTAPARKHREETALVPTVTMVNGALQPQSITEAMEMADMLSDSGMVPKDYEGRPGAALVAIIMGAELGLPPMASIQNIAVINGRPSIWGDAGLAIVRSHPQFVDIVEELDVSDPKNPTAVCLLTRKGSTPVERRFSWSDAHKAGLADKKGPWTNYPQRMLQMRARWFAMRDAFPDALGGINSAEEADDIRVIDQRPEFVDEEGAPVVGKHRFAGQRVEAPPQNNEAPDWPPTQEQPEPAGGPETSRSGEEEQETGGPEQPQPQRKLDW